MTIKLQKLDFTKTLTLVKVYLYLNRTLQGDIIHLRSIQVFVLYCKLFPLSPPQSTPNHQIFITFSPTYFCLIRTKIHSELNLSTNLNVHFLFIRFPLTNLL